MSAQTPTAHDDIITSKNDIELAETASKGDGPDPALKIIGDERVEVTEEDNVRIRKRTDKFILSMLMIVYFLQALDKTNFGYANVLGVSKDLGLVGNQYSLLNIILSSAQLAWQPISSYILVRVPPRVLMTTLIVCWGSIQTGMAGGTTFAAMMALRFFLGLFEAGCLPLFSLMTAQWYRRSEQPIRVAAWYSMNGISTLFAAVLSYGLSHIEGGVFHPWQALFLVCGLLTIAAAPFVWLFVDSSVAEARFLSTEDKAKALERLRANQTGVGTTQFVWRQALEVFYDPKTICFVGIPLCINAGTAVASAFGPTLIRNFGFDPYVTSLLNIPFGILQLMVILFSSWAALKVKSKSIPLAILVVPSLIGCILLYTEGTSGNFRQPVALVGYYLLAFNFGCNPLIVSWMVANTAGQTKKSVIMAIYNASAAAGNIIGPLLFNANDAPYYIPGIRGVLGIFSAQLACVGAQVLILIYLNRVRRRQRVAAGKPAYIKDTSMTDKYEAYGNEGEGLGQNALSDLTDFQNNEFVYIY